MSGRRWLVALAIAYGMAWVALPAGVNADSNGYLAESRVLLRPGWTTYHPPGYAAFLAVLSGPGFLPLPWVSVVPFLASLAFLGGAAMLARPGASTR